MTDQQSPQATPRPSPARPAIYVDLKRCIGCNACSVACKQENNVRIGELWNRVFGVETGSYPAVDVRVLPMLCQQCLEAPCKLACDRLGHQAMIRRPDGILYVDQNRCTGCQHCITACPFKAIFLNPETNKAEKCHLCMHRIDAGLAPACVITCLGITREFGRYEDLASKHRDGEFMVSNARTALSVLYANLGDEPPRDSGTAGYPGAGECHA